jgi:hypothetical protein
MFRKTAQAAFVVVLFSAPLSGQEWAAKMFSATTHDFGTVARGEHAEYAFVLENLYLEEVHIASVRASCSCTHPEIQTPTLKTHEKGAILAKFQTSAFLGAKGATLTVTFDKPFFAEVQLEVRGYIRDDVAMSPGIADFGEVDEDSPREREVLVNHTGADDWQIVGTRCTSPHLSASVTEVRRDGTLVTYRVIVRLDRQAPPGYFAEHAILDTSDPQNRQVLVPIAGKVGTPISLCPSTLFMGLVQPGQKVTKQLVVRARQPFQVSEVLCEGAGFFAAVDDGAAKKTFHLISVTFDAGNGPRKAMGNIHVGTTIGSLPPVKAYATLAAP